LHGLGVGDDAQRPEKSEDLYGASSRLLRCDVEKLQAHYEKVKDVFNFSEVSAFIAP